MINAECNYFDLVFLINHTLLVKVEVKIYLNISDIKRQVVTGHLYTRQGVF